MMTSIPRWGRVVARPHEHLVHMRRGRVIQAGNGLSIFKWPSDSVSIVSTAIQKLSFRADQVTLEKTGVEVTGLAVYRVAEPLLAFRMLADGTHVLGDVLRDMFVGATRRIVATLSLEECIAHRKERVAEALLREIAPVLSGEGRPDDGADQGWGVVLDTIEIQDVRVLSEEVFSRLQAPFRERLALSAIAAEEEVVRERSRLELERRRAEEQARRAMMHEEEARLERERAREVEARAHADRLLAVALDAEIDRARRATEAAREKAAIELDAERARRELEAALARLEREACADLSEARLREIMLTRTLPEVAVALRGVASEVRVTTSDVHVARLFELGGEWLAGALGPRRA